MQSIGRELKDKVLNQGSWLNLFLAINIVVFIVPALVGVAAFLFNSSLRVDETVQEYLAMPAALPALASRFWTPLTYMFAHAGFTHILFNMLWLYFFGRLLEEFIHKKHFLFVYIGGGLAGALLYLLTFNLLPGLSALSERSLLIGASGSVMAVVIAAATLVPDYRINLLFLGEVRIKYIALVKIVLDILMLLDNPGGGFAHLGGAVFGYIYIRQLRSGNDLSRIFRRPSTLKVVSTSSSSSARAVPDQVTVDRLLDKISRSGYESLTRSEKEELFRASKHDETDSE